MQPTTETITCKNCGNQFQGRYCNACGEKVYTDHDKNIGHILEEVFHFMTHFEGTFFNTLKTFLKSPGKLSLDYANGIRKKYFKPVSFFLLLVVLYLLFPRFQGLNMLLQTYATDQYGYTWATVPVIKAKMQKKQLGFKEVADKYNAKSGSVAKIALFLFIPLSALVLAVLFLPRKQPLFDHFVLAIELCSFVIFLNFLFLPLLAFIVEKTIPQYSYIFDDGSWMWDVFEVLSVLFVTIAFRRFYSRPYWIALPKAVLFLFVFGSGIRYLCALIVFYATMLLV